MAKKKQKYYVVWQGTQPGIYDRWEDCEKQIKGVAGAKFKSFDTKELAEQAFRLGFDPNPSPAGGGSSHPHRKSILIKDSDGMMTIDPSVGPDQPRPELNALAVDAACSGNPGVMEYQGVHILTGQQMFHFKADVGTNNIGEFLAIVHGLAWMKQKNINWIMYSDSVNAQNWVKAKTCRTKLPYTEQTKELYNLIRRAEAWLANNSYSTEIRKWDTDNWGEIPADFGRK